MEIVFETVSSEQCQFIEVEDFPDTDEPVWILGKKFYPKTELDSLRKNVTSKFWFTYRRGFVPIGGEDGWTSDKGWGCMLRCGQMVLAQALTCLHLDGEWTWDKDTKDKTYLNILSKFEDRRQAPFSIHQIALMGLSEGKNVGQWFGPNTVAQVLKKLVVYDEWSSISIFVALDNTIIINEMKEHCRNSLKNVPWSPLLLVVPLRLGLTEMNPIYIGGVQNCFKLKYSVGAIGGKPNLALYFIGIVENEVVYLDPHTTQRAGSVEDKSSDEQIELDSTYHCKFASRMPISEMDPSIAVCFFCRNESELDDLCRMLRDTVLSSENHPLFELVEERPSTWYELSEGISENAGQEQGDISTTDLEDFEIL